MHYIDAVQYAISTHSRATGVRHQESDRKVGYADFRFGFSCKFCKKTVNTWILTLFFRRMHGKMGEKMRA